jgi:hypothetical protein
MNTEEQIEEKKKRPMCLTSDDHTTEGKRNKRIQYRPPEYGTI